MITLVKPADIAPIPLGAGVMANGIEFEAVELMRSMEWGRTDSMFVLQLAKYAEDARLAALESDDDNVCDLILAAMRKAEVLRAAIREVVARNTR